MIDLDGVVMHVAETASNGVVDASTILRFQQRGVRVWATYSGGKVQRGWLVGRRVGDGLTFRYAQCERDGTVHGGSPRCDVLHLDDGRVRVVEYFKWSTRTGRGINLFDELAEYRSPLEGA